MPDAPRPRPGLRVGLAIAQAAVYALLAWELRSRGVVDAGLLGLSAGLQLVVAVAGGRPEVRRLAAGGTLVAVLVVWGRFFSLAVHARAEIGPETAAQLAQTFGATAVALPWLLVVPLVQLAGTGWGRLGAATPLSVLPGLLLVAVDPPQRLDPGAVVRLPLKRVEVFPGLRVPRPSEVQGQWSPAPELSPANLDRSVAAGARHLVHNLGPDGRYTYIVKGPSGDPGPGYNYPRHAGTTWFLARAATALAETEPEAAAVADEGARRALGHLYEETRTTPDGRAYVIDPTRRDGRAWGGTTALAVMALAHLVEHGATVSPTERTVLDGWVAQLAASVDADGKVRGEMTVSDGQFPEQLANPYGQGQVMLALAVAERAGLRIGEAALGRAAAYVDQGYLGTARPLATGDEHWMCLAAHAIADVRGAPAGAGLCATYVAQERFNAPVDGGGLPPAAGPAAGAAEAVIARAWDTKDARLAAVSARYGRLFLANQYREADTPFLGKADRLVGGFRDSQGDLDVQIDAVQHVGCALLGIEALLSGRERPGSLP